MKVVGEVSLVSIFVTSIIVGIMLVFLTVDFRFVLSLSRIDSFVGYQLFVHFEDVIIYVFLLAEIMFLILFFLQELILRGGFLKG